MNLIGSNFTDFYKVHTGFFYTFDSWCPPLFSIHSSKKWLWWDPLVPTPSLTLSPLFLIFCFTVSYNGSRNSDSCEYCCKEHNFKTIFGCVLELYFLSKIYKNQITCMAVACWATTTFPVFVCEMIHLEIGDRWVIFFFRRMLMCLLAATIVKKKKLWQLICIQIL